AALTLDWSNTGSTAGQLLGYNATDSSGAVTVGAGNDTIVFNDTAGGPYTATVASGTYTSGSSLASAIQNALNDKSATGSTVNDFVVNYNSSTNKFDIETSNTDAGLAINWTGVGSGTFNQSQIGFGVGSFNVTTSTATTATSSSSVSIDGQSDNTVVANYYSFNNNYLNDKYILRALNFEQQSLQNNDSGRAQQSIKYTTDLSAAVSQF